MTKLDMETRTDTIISRRTLVSPGQARRIMTGDRFCTKCGYNLVGQEIVREKHYELLIVRCPECATVTGLQDYPRLGTWPKLPCNEFRHGLPIWRSDVMWSCCHVLHPGSQILRTEKGIESLLQRMLYCDPVGMETL